MWPLSPNQMSEEVARQQRVESELRMEVRRRQEIEREEDRKRMALALAQREYKQQSISYGIFGAIIGGAVGGLLGWLPTAVILLFLGLFIHIPGLYRPGPAHVVDTWTFWIWLLVTPVAACIGFIGGAGMAERPDKVRK